MPMNSDQTVELFCGRDKTFSQLAGALGYKTFTVDRDPGVSPNLVADIGDIPSDRMPSSPLILWAAPPFSPVFNDRKSWESDASFDPLSPEAETFMAMIRKTINLTTALHPTWWFIEHPKSLMRKMPTFAGFNRGYPTRNRHTIKHDEYGGQSGKETDVWTNAFWWIPRPGETSPGGAARSTRLPPSAIAEILNQLDAYRLAKAGT